jgi:hypothetical protein
MAELKGVTVLFIILIFLNICIFNLAKYGSGIRCPNMEYFDYSNQTTEGNHTTSFGFRDTVNLVRGRCEGLPFWFILILEIPLLATLGYLLATLIPFIGG